MFLTNKPQYVQVLESVVYLQENDIFEDSILKMIKEAKESHAYM